LAQAAPHAGAATGSGGEHGDRAAPHDRAAGATQVLAPGVSSRQRDDAWCMVSRQDPCLDDQEMQQWQRQQQSVTARRQNAGHMAGLAAPSMAGSAATSRLQPATSASNISSQVWMIVWLVWLLLPAVDASQCGMNQQGLQDWAR
jgi:hypothetical protein